MKMNDKIAAHSEADTRPVASPDGAARLGFGGEFRSRAQEQAFGWSRLGETMRHARWLLIAAAILNTFFYISDWRFLGTSQFLLAIPARTVVVLASLLCLALLRRCNTPESVRQVMAGWVVVTALAVGVLVTSGSELALFVVLLLPMVFYLGVPLPYWWTIAGGIGTSAILLIGYEGPAPAYGTILGLGTALATLNCCLALVVARSNRLQRLEWQATQAARALARELSASREALEKMFAAGPLPMVVTAADDGRILQVNDACARMFGILPEMIGVESFERFYADPGERRRLLNSLHRHGRVEDFETRMVCADGVTRTVLVKVTTIDLASGRRLIAGIVDISERKAVELNLEWLASTDPLTRLPNRLSFFSTARAEMGRALRDGNMMALLMIDLDHFKVVNDTFGHHGGDQALRAFAMLCIDRLRGTDIIGRLGGEEFGVLLPGTNETQARAIAEAICRALAELRLPPPHGALTLTASIGFTLIAPEEKNLDAALARADHALYAAKRAGRNRVCFQPVEIVTPARAAR